MEQENNMVPTAPKLVENPDIPKNNGPIAPITLDLTPVEAEWVEQQPEVAATKSLPCSFFSCSAGHLWPQQCGLVACPGCKGPVIAIRFQNCPFCNEPAIRWTLRVDRIPTGPGGQVMIPARCCGQDGPGETHMVDFEQVEATRPESQRGKE